MKVGIIGSGDVGKSLGKRIPLRRTSGQNRIAHAGKVE
jgi:hypothetical protein